MAPDDEYSVPGLVRVIDLTLPEPPFRAYGRSEYLIPPHELVAALRVMADDPGAADLDAYRQEPAATRDLLVCTHGAVDACCAKFGYPVYRRLRQIAAESALPVPVRVWRCTHFGGHRFAATLLDMPEGRYLGAAGGAAPAASGAARRARGRVAGVLPRLGGVAASLAADCRGRGVCARRLGLDDVRHHPGDTPPEEANSAEIALSYTHEARGERGEIAVAVLPDGAVMTQTELASPDLVETPQYRTEVRRIAPSNGLLGNMRDWILVPGTSARDLRHSGDTKERARWTVLPR
jgi:hypothetical protein